MTSSTYLSQQTRSTPTAWPGAQQANNNLLRPATRGPQGGWTAAQARATPGTGRPAERGGLGTESPELPQLSAATDSLENPPVDGWLIWVLFLLALLGGLSVALLIGF